MFYLAVDFDGTIAKHRYPNIGDPVPGAFKWLKKFQSTDEVILILWTMRSDGPMEPFLTEALEFCADRGVVFDFANEHPQDWTTSPKVYAHCYIDDSAFGCPLKPDSERFGRLSGS